ncbi:hypothetical protein DPMN_138911 [Dreissena polymorpha]|uniref:Uncharacterized protein n=1 Tax=Dreissena polymorpha TaxID=45954 RepID=A0A9D4JF55_DREPO|nr:hypothetical protein DPMN_138911 [Dreissena polymorpha]
MTAHSYCESLDSLVVQGPIFPQYCCIRGQDKQMVTGEIHFCLYKAKWWSSSDAVLA